MTCIKTLSRFMPPPMDLQETDELRMLLVFSKADENSFDRDVADKLFEALNICDKNVTFDQPGDYCCSSLDGRVKITICKQPTYGQLLKYLAVRGKAQPCAEQLFDRRQATELLQKLAGAGKGKYSERAQRYLEERTGPVS